MFRIYANEEKENISEENSETEEMKRLATI